MTLHTQRAPNNCGASGRASRTRIKQVLSHKPRLLKISLFRRGWWILGCILAVEATVWWSMELWGRGVYATVCLCSLSPPPSPPHRPPPAKRDTQYMKAFLMQHYVPNRRSYTSYKAQNIKKEPPRPPHTRISRKAVHKCLLEKSMGRHVEKTKLNTQHNLVIRANSATH